MQHQLLQIHRATAERHGLAFSARTHFGKAHWRSSCMETTTPQTGRPTSEEISVPALPRERHDFMVGLHKTPDG